MSDHVYAYSELSDTWYRVFDYERAGSDGKIICNGKEEVDRSEVPDEWVEAISENAEIAEGSQ